MKPKRKPMFTTLAFCLLMANQAVETQTIALEQTVHQISISKDNREKNQNNKIILEKENQKLEIDKPYNKKYDPKKTKPEKTPFVEKEKPPPRKNHQISYTIPARPLKKAELFLLLEKNLFIE